MCGRYTLYTSPAKIAAHFHLHQVLELIPRFNIAPSQAVPIIRGEALYRELTLLRWGLIPHWSKEEKTPYNLINARAETVATKPTFQEAFRQRRCLIPADGFYEWKAGADGKQPYYIRHRDGEIFAFAGLWEHWEGETGKSIDSCAIIVTDANKLIQPIHDRMPVILEPADYDAWLNPQNQAANTLTALLKFYPPEKMKACPVSKKVNRPTNDDSACITPLP